MPALRAPGKNKGRRIAPPAISVRLSGHITLEAQPDGTIAARFDGHSIGLGKFSSATVKSAQDLLAHIASSAPGTTIKVTGLRGRATFEGTITVRQRPRNL